MHEMGLITKRKALLLVKTVVCERRVAASASRGCGVLRVQISQRHDATFPIDLSVPDQLH